MDNPDIQIQPSSEEQSETVHSLLRAYNSRHMDRGKDYSCHIEDNGKIVAGVVAQGVFDTLEVEFLYVDPEYRKHGYGSRLLVHIEELAKKDGLKRALLDTYTFQAPHFYPKLGYVQVASIEPCFGNCNQYFFVKEL